ncbi:hypothetical protein, partial [Gluconacetobacter entanii]|uniref:hypothetical protein n=1 Tax=Gluconacetobacter entanii TaxID=108528 RepID=UPI00223663DB
HRIYLTQIQQNAANISLPVSILLSMTRSVAAGVPFGEAGFTEIAPHCQRLMQNPKKRRKTGKPVPKTPIPGAIPRKKSKKRGGGSRLPLSPSAYAASTSVRVNSMPVNRRPYVGT